MMHSTCLERASHPRCQMMCAKTLSADAATHKNDFVWETLFIKNQLRDQLGYLPNIHSPFRRSDAVLGLQDDFYVALEARVMETSALHHAQVLDSFLSSVLLRSSPWPCPEQCLGSEDDDGGMPALLRELWHNDHQQLLSPLLVAPTAWPLQPHCRARRQRQPASSKQQLQPQHQVQQGLELPQASSSSTSGGTLAASSYGSSLSSDAITGQASTGSCCKASAQPTMDKHEQQQLQRAAAEQQLCATADHAAGQQQDCDDVSKQKAAAQARFAEQQCLQAGGSTSTRVDPAVLQQELARLEQQGPQARVFASILLCNLLCCLMVLAARGSVRDWLAGSWLQLPLLLALSGGLGWLFMSQLKPMHFADASVEQQYAARSQYGRCLLDLWFSMAGCSGVLAAVRSDGPPAPGTKQPSHTPASGPAAATSHLAALQSAVPVLLIAVLLSGVLLLLAAPRVYRRWREQLLFVGKLSIVLGTVALQPGCGAVLQVGPGWLPLLAGGPSRAQMHAASILLAMGTVQAFLLLTLTVRVSAYIPMQLIHVSALLATVANSGTSGLGMVAYALQLLTCSLWAPTCILAQLESSSRRAFLVRQLPHAKKA